MFLKKILSRYNSALNQYPMLTNCTTGFIVATIGDLFAQKYVHSMELLENTSSNHIVSNPFELNLSRVFEMGCIRATVITPFITIW